MARHSSAPRKTNPGQPSDADRGRTHFAAVLAVVGAVMFVAGATLAQVASLLVPWGCLLLMFGGLAVVRAVLIGLGVLPVPQTKQDPPDGRS